MTRAANIGNKETTGEKTFQYQESLPSLPLPSLEQTLEAYIESCEPLLNEQELLHTKSVCYEFLHGVGPKLQEILEERASDERNWLKEWWETFAYLQPRYPSAINVNWYGVLPGNWGPRDMSQVEAAAIFTHAMLHFREALLTESYPVERMAGQPLCMYTYTRMFNSCIIPGEECDEIEVYPQTAKHIIVLRNDGIWAVKVLDDEGRILPLEDILAQFEAVRQEATGLFTLVRHPGVSVLTSENRTNWAKTREYMLKLDAKNKESLECIQQALFCVALDESSPNTSEEIARKCLLGTGRNRWYDKPITMIIFENGLSGSNGEHTWADALVVVRLFNFCIKLINSNLSTYLNRPRPVAKNVIRPRKLSWVLDTHVNTAIECASVAVSKLINASALTVLQFRHYGDAFIKRHKLAPDFYIQLAIQLAFYKVHHHIPAVYETAHTRLFYHGRTETMRSLTTDSLNFCKIMEKPGASMSEKWEAMRKAILTHGTKIKQALMGQGIDRHLMGLMIVSEMSGVSPKPSLFTDKAFDLSKTYRISTSNISGGRNLSPVWGGFSAVCNDGNGICYGIQPDHINFSISGYHVCPENDVNEFKKHLEIALVEMLDVCVASNQLHVGASNL